MHEPIQQIITDNHIMTTENAEKNAPERQIWRNVKQMRFGQE